VLTNSNVHFLCLVFEVLVPVKNGLFPSLFVENFALACLSLHFQRPVNKISDVNVTDDITKPITLGSRLHTNKNYG